MGAPAFTRFYEDLPVGETAESEPYTVTQDAILAFAEEFDPQWFHLDPEAAKTSIFGGLIASGLHVMALWRKLDHTMNADLAVTCVVGLADTRFARPARPGDALRAFYTVREARPSRSWPAHGLVTLFAGLKNQDEAVVLSNTATILVARRPGDESSAGDGR